MRGIDRENDRCRLGGMRPHLRQLQKERGSQEGMTGSCLRHTFATMLSEEWIFFLDQIFPLTLANAGGNVPASKLWFDASFGQKQTLQWGWFPRGVCYGATGFQVENGLFPGIFECSVEDRAITSQIAEFFKHSKTQ